MVAQSIASAHPATSFSMTQWYWCQRHERAEPEGEACRALDRLGPYATREQAEDWQARAEARNEAWEDQDRAWAGEDEDE
jgi:hypothetical protein